MKKIVFATLIGLFLLFGISGQASAVPLPIGGLGFPTGAVSPGAGLVTSLSVPFTGIDAFGNIWFTGTLNQWVRTSGLGLVFEYQFVNDPGSLASISLLDATNYDSFLTNVDATGPGVSPFFFTRTFPGNAVSFNYPFGVAPGSSSSLLWVETNTPYYGLGTTQLQGTGNTRLVTYSPAVPEPASMLLLGMGVGALGLVRRRRKA